MKKLLLVLASMVLSLTASANPRLEAAMKALVADFKLVQEPTKAANPADVKDAALNTAVIRARLMSTLLQSVSDKRGKVENGSFVAGEMSPPNLGALPTAELEKKLDLYAKYLGDARVKLALAEGAVETELKKAASARDFTALKSALVDLGAVIGAAHKVFKPAP